MPLPLTTWRSDANAMQLVHKKKLGKRLKGKEKGRKLLVANCIVKHFEKFLREREISSTFARILITQFSSLRLENKNLHERDKDGIITGTGISPPLPVKS